jgi:hypothetical protein
VLNKLLAGVGGRSVRHLSQHPLRPTPTPLFLQQQIASFQHLNGIQQEKMGIGDMNSRRKRPYCTGNRPQFQEFLEEPGPVRQSHTGLGDV